MFNTVKLNILKHLQESKRAARLLSYLAPHRKVTFYGQPNKPYSAVALTYVLAFRRVAEMESGQLECRRTAYCAYLILVAPLECFRLAALSQATAQKGSSLVSANGAEEKLVRRPLLQPMFFCVVPERPVGNF